MDPITINLVILAASYILSSVLAPKPQKPKPTAFEDIDFPRCDEGDEQVRRIDANLAVTGDRTLPCGLSARADCADLVDLLAQGEMDVKKVFEPDRLRLRFSAHRLPPGVHVQPI
ncbi:hypothetical protein AO989_33110 [Pseudomonas aeruginosa]|nr:hypothetical protein AO989_33110 [Pseudomonas aeruginosa]